MDDSQWCPGYAFQKPKIFQKFPARQPRQNTSFGSFGSSDSEFENALCTKMNKSNAAKPKAHPIKLGNKAGNSLTTP